MFNFCHDLFTQPIGVDDERIEALTRQRLHRPLDQRLALYV